MKTPQNTEVCLKFQLFQGNFDAIDLGDSTTVDFEVDGNLNLGDGATLGKTANGWQLILPSGIGEGTVIVSVKNNQTGIVHELRIPVQSYREEPPTPTPTSEPPPSCPKPVSITYDECVAGFPPGSVTNGTGACDAVCDNPFNPSVDEKYVLESTFP